MKEFYYIHPIKPLSVWLLSLTLSKTQFFLLLSQKVGLIISILLSLLISKFLLQSQKLALLALLALLTISQNPLFLYNPHSFLSAAV
jgi:hypothetical protein